MGSENIVHLLSPTLPQMSTWPGPQGSAIRDQQAYSYKSPEFGRNHARDIVLGRMF